MKTDKYLIWSRAKENFFKSSKISTADKKSNAIRMLQKHPMFLEYLTDYQDNSAVVKNALQQNGYALKFCSDRLRNDKKIVQIAMRNNQNAIVHASFKLKNDPSIFLNESNFDNFSGLLDSPKFKAYPILYFASDQIKKNKKVVHFLIKRDPRNLIFAADKFRHNLNQANQIVICNFRCYPYISANLRADKKIMLQVLTTGTERRGFIYRGFSINIIDPILEDVANNFSVDYISDRKFILTFVRLLKEHTNLLINYRFSEMINFWKDDREIMSAIIYYSVFFYSRASRNLQCDRKFFSQTLARAYHQQWTQLAGPVKYNMFQDAPVELLNLKAFALRALKINSEVYDSLSEKLRSDEKIVLQYIRFGSYRLPDNFDDFPKIMKQNPKYIKEILIAKKYCRFRIPSPQSILSKGVSPNFLFRYVSHSADAHNEAYIPILNLKPGLSKSLHDINLFQGFIYKRLNRLTREAFFNRYLILVKKNQTKDGDFFKIAAQINEMRKTMMLTKVKY